MTIGLGATWLTWLNFGLCEFGIGGFGIDIGCDIGILVDNGAKKLIVIVLGIIPCLIWATAGMLIRFTVIERVGSMKGPIGRLFVLFLTLFGFELR